MKQCGDFTSQCHFGLGTRPTPRIFGSVHKGLKLNLTAEQARFASAKRKAPIPHAPIADPKQRKFTKITDEEDIAEALDVFDRNDRKDSLNEQSVYKSYRSRSTECIHQVHVVCQSGDNDFKGVSCMKDLNCKYDKYLVLQLHPAGLGVNETFHGSSAFQPSFQLLYSKFCWFSFKSWPWNAIIFCNNRKKTSRTTHERHILN